jgi:hypothetical protein
MVSTQFHVARCITMLLSICKWLHAANKHMLHCKTRKYYAARQVVLLQAAAQECVMLLNSYMRGSVRSKAVHAARQANVALQGSYYM